MDWQHRRLLELAGIKRRRTPDHLLTEGEDEGGGDDLFGDDSGGDDAGGDDLFGGDDDAGGDDTGGEDEGGGGEADGAPGSNREPPEELDARDVEKFGSPRFLDLENKLQKMFNDAWASGSAAAQGIEGYAGNAIDEEPPTPAKDDSPPKEEEEEAGDEGGEDEGKDEKEEEGDDKNESFYRFGNRRDKWLITEAMRLLNEAESEGSSADEFDMERFCTELANYLDTIHNTEDIEGAIFNSARQMILNNFGKQTEGEFIDMLAGVTDNKWDFLGTHGDVDQVPLAVGASAAAAGAQMSKGNKNARVKYYTEKSIHIKVTLAQHAAFKKKLADYGLQMREVLHECIERICDPDNAYMEGMLNECVENKLVARDHISLEGDVENLYKLIEENGSSGSKSDEN